MVPSKDLMEEVVCAWVKRFGKWKKGRYEDS